MASFHVPVEIEDLGGGAFDHFEALVDTGATYTWVPSDILERLGIRAQEQRPFIMADGREAFYPLAWVRVRIGGRSSNTLVIFGTPGSEPLLGVVTLEEFGLAADPVNRRLVSVPGRLKAALTARCLGAQFPKEPVERVLPGRKRRARKG